MCEWQCLLSAQGLSMDTSSIDPGLVSPRLTQAWRLSERKSNPYELWRSQYQKYLIKNSKKNELTNCASPSVQHQEIWWKKIIWTDEFFFPLPKEVLLIYNFGHVSKGDVARLNKMLPSKLFIWWAPSSTNISQNCPKVFRASPIHPGEWGLRLLPRASKNIIYRSIVIIKQTM